MSQGWSFPNRNLHTKRWHVSFQLSSFVLGPVQVIEFLTSKVPTKRNNKQSILGKSEKPEILNSFFGVTHSLIGASSKCILLTRVDGKQTKLFNTCKYMCCIWKKLTIEKIIKFKKDEITTVRRLRDFAAFVWGNFILINSFYIPKSRISLLHRCNCATISLQMKSTEHVTIRDSYKLKVLTSDKTESPNLRHETQMRNF